MKIRKKKLLKNSIAINKRRLFNNNKMMQLVPKESNVKKFINGD